MKHRLPPHRDWRVAAAWANDDLARRYADTSSGAAGFSVPATETCAGNPASTGAHLTPRCSAPLPFVAALPSRDVDTDETGAVDPPRPAPAVGGGPVYRWQEPCGLGLNGLSCSLPPLHAGLHDWEEA